jgi:hypothetical protein
MQQMLARAVAFSICQRQAPALRRPVQAPWSDVLHREYA